MDADIPVAHQRLMDEVVIFGDRGSLPSRVRSLYPLYGLLGIAYVFIFILCVVSFSRVHAISEKAEALKSEVGADFDQLYLKAQNTSSRVDAIELDLSSLKSEAQKPSSRVKAIGSDVSSLKLQVSVLSSQFLALEKAVEIETPCGFLWKQFEDHCYFFYKGELNWMDAKVMCEAKNATLAVITSAREQNFLSSRTDNERYWIGLSDLNKEGEWEWIDGTDYNSSYKFWKTDEPNNFDRSEDCAHLWSMGEWNDVHCTYVCNAICERQL
ncbi:hepatic lectin isoform X2 [Microcaecilia unicolor]|uniref:Hepatic lectin-like isoform X2 n=1 Tax=Microcaecilia unicolor TaxID=1415580 RepID=A0A6P7XRA7_9AMPH|nr:hepatic lectin-like isoform X2 [Microcaecilia unicolor]